MSEITDGLSNTILLVEVANSGIHWMEPLDLPTSVIQSGINPPQSLGPSSNHPGGIQVAFGDGSVLFIPQDISKPLLEAMFTRAGDEDIDNPYTAARETGVPRRANARSISSK